MLTTNILNRYLGPYAYGWIDDMCKERWESSDPELTEPISVDATPGIDVSEPITVQAPQEEGLDEALEDAICGDSDTSMTIMGRRQATEDGFEYQVMYHIRACGEWQDSSYSIRLENPSTIVEEGTISRGESVTEQEVYSLPDEYERVCLDIAQEEERVCQPLS
jgi:hypothetical protein